MAELRVGGAAVVRANAVRLPLRDESVDLIVTSPPYHGLRSYRDGGIHYEGQIGSEATSQEFLLALWEVMKDCWRVLKPTGSCFINLGDRRSGSGGHNNSGISKHGTGSSTLQGNGKPDVARRAALMEQIRVEREVAKATRRNAPDRYTQAAFGRPKSKMLLPHRFAIGCEDGLADPCVRDHEHVGRHPAYLEHEECRGMGWVVRQDIVWSKLNGLPESVTDRTRDSHEYVFHLTKQGRYFSAVDEVREPHIQPLTAAEMASRLKGTKNSVVHGGNRGAGRDNGVSVNTAADLVDCTGSNPLGKLPGSVWPLASEPLVLSDAVKAHYDLPDHFAAFPQELPRRLILGWSPSGVCVACGEGRRPVVAKDPEYVAMRAALGDWRNQRPCDERNSGGSERPTMNVSITGYVCACATPDAPTRPAVVLDPFSGTGTVPGVARALGRFGVGVDLSHDYCRLAAYFMGDGRGRFAKTASRTDRERQGSLL